MSTQRRTLRFNRQHLSRNQRGTLLAYVAVIVLFIVGGISGERGNYWGSIAGAIFLVVLRAVLQQYDISEAGRSIVTGVVILVALLLYGREAREA
jgi:ribose/xylose/arabinose/galactoside ABC-type transport system permease subunit